MHDLSGFIHDSNSNAYETAYLMGLHHAAHAAAHAATHACSSGHRRLGLLLLGDDALGDVGARAVEHLRHDPGHRAGGSHTHLSALLFL